MRNATLLFAFVLTAMAAHAGEPTTVPFYPSQGRPVYCRSCYLELNPSVLNGENGQ